MKSLKTLIGCAVLLVVGALSGCETAAPAPSIAQATVVNYEGLATVASKRLSHAEVRPGVNFAAYTSVMAGGPELAFQTPDRSERQFAVTGEQVERFRALLADAFAAELQNLETLDVATAPGPNTLVLDVRVLDIIVSVSTRPVSAVGRGAAFLEASGQAVVVLELRDSESGEILARGVQGDTVAGVAARQRDGSMVTRFRASDEVVEEWAATARAALDALIRRQ